MHGDTFRIRHLVRIARRLGLGIVATNNVHYHVQERHRLQDVLVAIKHRTTLDASPSDAPAQLGSLLEIPEEMAELFRAPRGTRPRGSSSERCEAFDLTADLGYTFPDFEREDASEGADQHLERVCRQLLKERYGGGPLFIAERRSAWIRSCGLSGATASRGFSWSTATSCALPKRWPRRCGDQAKRAQGARLPPGRGRGSSVSSLVCYLIGLSHVDPVQNNLSIDRFLNETLHVVPDIDLDFARDIREALIVRVYRRYGQEHAALVCSFATYRLRSAVRDIGKALGLPPPELDSWPS